MLSPTIRICAHRSEDRRQLHFTDGTHDWQLQLECQGDTAMLSHWEGPAVAPEHWFALLDTLFTVSGSRHITLAPGIARERDTRHPAWLRRNGEAMLGRDAFYQIREAWLCGALLPLMPETPTYTGAVEHPRRPALGDQLLYRRPVPDGGPLLELRQAHPDVDGENFHRWQNDPRVARFWEYPFSRKQLDQMLMERRDDPHSLPLMLLVDGRAVGYFEAYYVAEDRLGPYCDAGPFDLGLHVLLGEARRLDPALTPLLLNSLCHFLFLVEPRCQCLYGEPRSDNRALLRHLNTTTWTRQREFDFPHKRATLVTNQRRRFFRASHLGAPHG